MGAVKTFLFSTRTGQNFLESIQYFVTGAILSQYFYSTWIFLSWEGYQFQKFFFFSIARDHPQNLIEIYTNLRKLTPFFPGEPLRKPNIYDSFPGKMQAN